jgi:hypothetical protein
MNQMAPGQNFYVFWLRGTITGNIRRDRVWYAHTHNDRFCTYHLIPLIAHEFEGWNSIPTKNYRFLCPGTQSGKYGSSQVRPLLHSFVIFLASCRLRLSVRGFEGWNSTPPKSYGWKCLGTQSGKIQFENEKFHTGSRTRNVEQTQKRMGR